jgi:Ca2+-binding RTX toxin-like protein
VSSIGMNLTSVNYWSTQEPFIDRFMTSNEWVLRDPSGKITGEAAPLDRFGEVTTLEPGYMLSSSFAVDPLSAGKVNSYVFTYEGTGTFSFTGAKVISSEPGRIVLEPTRTDATPAVYVVMKSSDPADPVHDIHAVRADQVAQFEAGEIFNPDFLAKADDWSTLRFMDWGGTNTLQEISWDSRATLDDANWASQSNGDGVPLEIKVALANQTGSDMWFNIPSMADDTYVANAMAYIRDNLDPTLKVHLEYSNEVWNWSFAVAKYAMTMGNNLFGTDANGDGVINPDDKAEAVQGNYMIYYGYRSAQIADIAKEVFSAAPDRLETVVAVQTGNSGLFQYIQDGIARAGVGTTAELFDELAVTTYFGHEISMASSNAADKAIVLGWAQSGEAGMAAAFKELETGGALSSDLSMAVMAKQLANQAAIANANGLTMVAYEGGAHLTPASFSGDDQTVMIDFINRLMNDPRMGELYTKMVGTFEAAGGDLLMAFADTGTSTKSGYWGNLDSIYQDSSVRYDALLAASKSEGPRPSVPPHGTVPGYQTVGGDDDDTLTARGAAHLVGNGGNDTLIGSAYNDSLDGGAGDDWLEGGTGNDTLVGDGGNDTYVVSTTTGTLVEAVDGGTDTILTSLNAWTLADNFEVLAYSGDQRFTGVGNALDNLIAGSNKSTTLYGLGGSDTLIGGDGADTLDGGTGADIMRGGLGNDVYYVDDLHDIVVEAADGGRDTVNVSTTRYTLSDNVENLVALVGGTFTGNALDNQLLASNVSTALYGLDGNDSLRGGDGDDTLDGGSGVDTMMGGLGNDVYYIDDVNERANEGVDQGIDEVRTTLNTYVIHTNVENATFLGTGAFNGMGNGLDNKLVGGSGDDTLSGSTGADTMIGNGGNDTYTVENVGDVVVEGANEGVDTVYTRVTYTLSANVENLVMQFGAVDATGNELDNLLQGTSTANVMRGLDGNDTINGDPGDDTLYGDAGNDSLNGGAANDVMYGGIGDDTLFGDNGNDTLVGGAGRDVMTGSTGADLFVFGEGDLGATIETTDLITDFARGEGDRIDLSAIDAITGTYSNDAFHFVGTDRFSGVAGELRVETSGSLLHVYGDTDGDGAANFALQVNSSSGTLIAGDFIL